jgi:2-dehydro-3-deoxyphosphogluconate aldolase/(4S)-4-hydroxy-2-oxoglutarate aldolase
MSMTQLDRIADIGVVPVVSIRRVDRAEAMGEALLAGGLACAEITFRTAPAAKVIESLRASAPELLTGAGTIVTTGDARRAIDAGAQFVVSPGLYPDVVDVCTSAGVPVLPGVITASELGRAVSMGLSHVKLFPVEPAGGLPLLRALAAPFPTIRFVPTGGIGPTNVRGYLQELSVAAVGGSWMVTSRLLDAGDWTAVRRLAAEAVAIVREVRSETGRPGGGAAQ